uniref:Putative lamb YcsF family protein n=1 Tax=Moniliophthora roreri TaxID=221103 RepID=A0A0W0FIG4_MONRR
MSSKPLKATVNCDMGEGYSLYTIGNDDSLMKTIHLANIACGFHASDFSVMDKTVSLAKQNGVNVGAHPSLPDRQGFGRREMAMKPDELESCFVYQIKPHGAIYGQTSRDITLARAAVGICKMFTSENQNVAFVGLPGTAHQEAAAELGVKFIPEWFADLDYSPEGKLIITQVHTHVTEETVRKRVHALLKDRKVTTVDGSFLPFGTDADEVSICCHSDTPDAVKVATLVKRLVDEHNLSAGL